MTSRRLLIVIAAVAAGLIASFLIYQYVGSLEDKAAESNQKISVAVAKAQIKRGVEAASAITEQRIVNQQRPRLDVPDSAIVRPEELKGLVAVYDIAPGTVLTSSMFVKSDELRNTNSTILGEGMIAVSLLIDSARNVAGLVNPGDYVNIMARGICTTDAAGSIKLKMTQEIDKNNPTEQSCVGMLYQKSKILAVDKSLGDEVATEADANKQETKQNQTNNLYTLEVPADVGQKIVAAPPGSHYLQLVRGDYQAAPMAPEISVIDLPGITGASPAPAAQAGQ